MSNNILVTGCTGVVGHGICCYLLDSGFKVFGTSRHHLHSLHSSFYPVQLDIENPKSFMQLEKVLNEINVIIHNAAIRPDGIIEEQRYFNINFTGTLDLLRIASNFKLNQFVFISGTAIVDQSHMPVDENAPYNPMNAYYSSKIAAEVVCQQYQIENKLPTIILRISAPYGYRHTSQSVIPRFISIIESGEKIPLWGTGSRQQVFTFVDDIGLACKLAIKRNCTGIYNISGPTATTMRELALTMLKIYPDSKSEINYTGNPDPQENRQVKISTAKAYKQFGYRPQFDIEAGLKKVMHSKVHPSLISIFEYADQ